MQETDGGGGDLGAKTGAKSPDRGHKIRLSVGITPLRGVHRVPVVRK